MPPSHGLHFSTPTSPTLRQDTRHPELTQTGNTPTALQQSVSSPHISNHSFKSLCQFSNSSVAWRCMTGPTVSTQTHHPPSSLQHCTHLTCAHLHTAPLTKYTTHSARTHYTPLEHTYTTSTSHTFHKCKLFHTKHTGTHKPWLHQMYTHMPT